MVLHLLHVKRKEKKKKKKRNKLLIFLSFKESKSLFHITQISKEEIFFKNHHLTFSLLKTKLLQVHY